MLSTLECVLIRPIAEAKRRNLQYSLYSPADTHARPSTHAEQKMCLKASCRNSLPHKHKHRPPVLCSSAGIHALSEVHTSSTYTLQPVFVSFNLTPHYIPIYMLQSTHLYACFGIVYIILFSLAELLI